MQQPSLRDTGLDIIGETPWGTHFCVFYETMQDLVDVVAPFFAAGVLADEMCVWLPSDPEAEGLVRPALRRRVPDIDRREAAGQLEFMKGDDWYRRGGRFDVEAVMSRWDDFDRRAAARGYSGLRLCGNLGWLDDDDRERANVCETRLPQFLHDRSILVLCPYPVEGNLAVHVFDIARSHDYVLARRRGRWETIQTPEHARALREIERLNRELEKRVEQRTAELRRSERYLAEAQRLAHGGSVAWSVETGEYTFWSTEQFRVFGFEPSTVPPRFAEVLARVHPDDRDHFLAARGRVVRDGRKVEWTARIVLPSGQTRHIRFLAYPMIDQGRISELVGVDVDITDRKRAAARVARIRRRAREQAVEARIAAILEERGRLAREIHDSLLQGVAGVALHLRALLPRLYSEAPEIGESIRRITELAEATARDARQTVWEMRPPALAHSDLPTALDETVRRVAPGLEVDVVLRGTPAPLPVTIEDTIVRVAQESAANAVKHSGTTRISVSLHYAPDSVVLSVADFGHGFDVASASRAAGRRWGLLGMRERAERIGASVTIRSGAGEGTVVTLEVPLAVRPGPDASTA